MRYFREIYWHTSTEIAHCLALRPMNLRFKTGGQLLPESLAKQLTILFNVKKDFLLEAGEQLDLLLAGNAIIIIQKEKIEYLRQQLQYTRNGILNKA